MADEPKETSEAEASSDGQQNEAPPKSRSGIVSIALVGAAVVLGLGGGYWGVNHFLGRPQAAAAKDAAPKKAHGENEKPLVYRLDDLVANPAGTGGQRYVMFSVAIEVEKPEDVTELQAIDARIRDRVIGYMSTRTVTEITVPGAMDTVRAALRQQLRLLAPTLGVREVLLPSGLVLQ